MLYTVLSVSFIMFFISLHIYNRQEFLIFWQKFLKFLARKIIIFFIDY